MAVGLSPPRNVLAVPGVRLGVTQSGIKYAGRDDLVVMAFDEGATAAGVFTRNAFCAAPVILARRHLQSGGVRAFVINSGNANAGTGGAGEQDALATARALATLLDCDETAVLPFSTGVIGERLPVQRMVDALPQAVDGLDENGWQAAAAAIMTTDTVPKVVSRQVPVGEGTVTVTGMAKGAGMIRPDMATMLAFLATDATVGQADLQAVLQKTVSDSFNAITIDGDTSTNDSCMLVATGRSGVRVGGDNAGDLGRFADAIDDICRELAQAIVRDGEGATRFITIEVSGATSRGEARDVAYTLAHSPLFKTAAFAGDPNWGRILAAVGRSGVPDLDVGKVDIWLDDVRIVRDGSVDAGYTEDAGAAVMARPEYRVHVALGRGGDRTRVWTCDLSYDYVRINAEYRS